MLRILRNIYYSFPIQLLIISLKKHQFLLAFWVFIFIIIVGKYGNTIGMPAVFLDPEYLGKVGYLSFSIVGMGMGVMYVTWNIVMYILHSHRFPFMASLQYPLGMFFINNSIIPVVFITSYIISATLFQSKFEYQGWQELTVEMLGFTAGFVLVVLITSLYFGVTNINTGHYLRTTKERVRKKRAIRKISFNEELEAQHFNRVDYYITNRLGIRHTRTVEHYDNKVHQFVFRRHHLNAFVAFLVTLSILVSIGFYLENPFFQIPIAASACLFISIIMSLFGMFLYWTGTWGSAAIIIFIMLANQLTKYDLFGYKSAVYGIDYNTEKAAYNLSNFRAIASNENIEADRRYFQKIFENWKKKNTVGKVGIEKPKLIFINVSGGGLRAGLFATAVLQRADSLLGGALFDKTFMISGASGGMFGVTYLRELYLRQKEGLNINMQDSAILQNVSRDLLNPLALSILSNDALLPYHKFKLGEHTYFKDRGYVFERFYCENTGLRFDKTLNDYKQAEFDAKVPLVIYHTTVINDSRRFFISPHPVSFLMRPYAGENINNTLDVDAIDFCRFFEKQGGGDLLITSAMRMDATFPFILPNPELPSEPATYVMDGGALDNFGTETTLRFLKTFKNWINENTSGVVIIQIRDTEKFEEPEATPRKTIFSRLTDPLGTVYRNMENMHDFLTDHRLNDVDEDLKGKINFVLFEYTTEHTDQKAAMSMHLNSRDKIDILRSVHRPNNKRAFDELRSICEPPKK